MVQVKRDQQQGQTQNVEGGKQHELKLKVDVENGLISGIFLLLGDASESIPVVSQLKGCEYNEDNFNTIYGSLKSIRPDAIMAQAINGSWFIKIDFRSGEVDDQVRFLEYIVLIETHFYETEI